MPTDRIEEHVHLKASRSRVWRALTDAKELGTLNEGGWTAQIRNIEAHVAG